MPLPMVVAFAMLLSFVPAATSAATTTVPIKHVYVLGDSLSDQGNLFFATFVLNPPGTPPVPDVRRYALGRFSNGPNYVDVLARKLGLFIWPSEFGGTNYAFGGSRTDHNRVEFREGVQPPLPQGAYPIGAFPWSLDRQRAEFLADVKHRKADPTGLYIVFHGSNDLADAFVGFLALQQHPGPTITKAVQGVVDAVLAFKSAGARTILVPLMPNLGLVPGFAALGPQASAFASGLALQFNAALVAALATIDGPNIVVFDTYEMLTDVVSNPAKYGLANVTQPCYSGFLLPDPSATVCANPERYAFWDIEHPTTRLHEILADALFTTALDCREKERGRGRRPVHCAVNKH